jgi:hypothetical protein
MTEKKKFYNFVTRNKIVSGIIEWTETGGLRHDNQYNDIQLNDAHSNNDIQHSDKHPAQ